MRAKVGGTASCPRFSIFRSNAHLYIQLVDDEAGKTILGISDKDLKLKSGRAGINDAKTLGKEIAKKAKEKGIERVVFDRSSYAYHGRVKAIADGAREEGLKF